MKRQLILIAVAFFFFTASSVAQGNDVPQAVKATFSNQYPGAENVEYKDNPLNVWVNFTLNGQKMSASYNKKGEWKHTEKDWSFDQLTQPVKDGFNKSKYASWEVTETVVIYMAGGSEQYRLRVKKNDLQKKYLYFNQKGRLLRDAITL